MATTEIKSLLHFDESATKDESYKTVWTLGENATLSSAQKKFGSSSLYLPTADSFIMCENNEFFRITAPNDEYKGVYEVEFFIWLDESVKEFNPVIFSGQLSNNESVALDKNYVKFYFNNIANNMKWNLTFKGTTSGSTTLEIDPEIFSYNTWHHFLLRMSFNTELAGREDTNIVDVFIFLDGKCIYSRNKYEYIDFSTVKIGNFVGYIDELVYRIIKVDKNATVNIYRDDPNSMTVPTSPYVYVASEADKLAYENRFKTTPQTDDEDFTESLDVPEVLQLRGGTKAVLAAVNPILARREIMVEVDTGQMKIGTGTRRWNNLKYVGDFQKGVVSE